MSGHPFSAFRQAFLPFVFEKEDVAEVFEIALLSRSHVLIEDFPGVGKTTIAKALAKLLGFSHSRIQGTSDTLPQDLVGGEAFDFATKEFSIRKGPVFAETVLIDEINRMHPKAQSAFLECMEEKTVSIAGTTFELPEFHFVIATQNPLEHVGTFPLPEAQKDRFACVVKIGYPSDEIQKRIMRSGSDIDSVVSGLSPVIGRETLREAVASVRRVHMDDKIVDGLVAFANWSRSEIRLKFGISPRGMAAFVMAIRAKAYLEGRDFAIPEDGRHLVVPFLSHRLNPFDQTLSHSEIP